VHYGGEPMQSGRVSLCAPTRRELSSAIAHSDLDEHQRGWFRRAERDDATLYFGVHVQDRVIGQIFLHDVSGREAMVGYHVFRRADRRNGYGTEALSGLCEFALGGLAMRRLVAITGVGNAASRRIAMKCGFREIGAAREGPHLVCYERCRDTRTCA